MKKETPYASTSSSRRILVVLALLLFIVALVLVIIQSATGSKSPVLRTYSQGYAAGYLAAREQAQQLGLPPDVASNRLEATITRVNGNSLEVQVTNLLMDESVDDVGLTRTISVTANTIVVLKEEKNTNELQTEIDAFNRTLDSYNPETDNELPEPPMSYVETPISQTDLSVGDMITIIGADDEDLRMQEAIDAVKILKRPVHVALEEPTEEAITQ